MTDDVDFLRTIPPFYAVTPPERRGSGYEFSRYAQLVSQVFEESMHSAFSNQLGLQVIQSDKPDAPDFAISSESVSSILAVELRVWRFSPKNSRNRVAEALSTSVVLRRRFNERIQLSLVVLVAPSEEDELEWDSRSGYDFVSHLGAAVRQHASDAGFDALIVGALGPKGGWARVDASGQVAHLPRFSEAISYLVRLMEAGDIGSERIGAPGDAVGEAPGDAVGEAPGDAVGEAPGDAVGEPPHTPKFLLIADEWHSRLGGISTFNRELAEALADVGCDVSVVVPSAAAAERDDASQRGVTLLAPNDIPGIEGKQLLLTRPEIGDPGYAPDVIVGHGRILGPYAFAMKHLFFDNARRLHFVHMNAEALELAKEYPGGPSRMSTSEERGELEADLAINADLVAGVGPHLAAYIANAMRGLRQNRPQVVEFRPGLRDWGDVVDPEDVPPLRQIVLVARAEDIISKGLDVAVEACADAVSRLDARVEAAPTLVIRGVPRGDENAVKERLDRLVNPHLSVVLRPYSAKEADIKRDLWRSRLLIMPSRHEGFGLAAYEAIAAGVPVLISKDSGLAELLTAVVTDGDRIIPREVLSVRGSREEVVEGWSTAIHSVLLDPSAAFRRAADVRAQLASRVSWRDSVVQLLGALDLPVPKA